MLPPAVRARFPVDGTALDPHPGDAFVRIDAAFVKLLRADQQPRDRRA